MDKSFWTAHIQAWRELGISKAAYCRQNSLVYSAFNYWCRCLSSESCEKPAEQTVFYEVDPSSLESGQRPDSRAAPAIELSLGKLDVRIYNGADPLLVSSLLNGIRS